MNEIGSMVVGFNKLVDTINERTTNLKEAKEELEQKLKEVNELRGLLPICSFCKKIRDDKEYWNQVERYIAKKTDALFSHSICPECMKEHYSFVKDEDLKYDLCPLCSLRLSYLFKLLSNPIQRLLQ